MHVTDWGILDSPIVLFGGPYSNAQATAALLDKAGGATLICTGDVVAYCADPLRTVDMVRAAGVLCVAGNCERQLAADALDCGCGFEEGSACDLLSAGWYGYARTAVGPEARDWMRGLPDIGVFQHHGARYAVIHGGATDIARFIWSVSAPEVLTEEWAAVEAVAGRVDVIVAGHSGLAFERALPCGRWINAGVIGMPAHCGHRRTEYVWLQDGAAQICALDYDAAAAHDAMCAAGLIQGYHTSLLTGYWPSEDVLPESLRRSSALASG